MNSDSPYTDYQSGTVVMEMEVTKLANGMFKASCQGLESNHHDQSRAVIDLQTKLQDALASGEIRPGM